MLDILKRYTRRGTHPHHVYLKRVYTYTRIHIVYVFTILCGPTRKPTTAIGNDTCSSVLVCVSYLCICVCTREVILLLYYIRSTHNIYFSHGHPHERLPFRIYCIIFLCGQSSGTNTVIINRMYCETDTGHRSGQARRRRIPRVVHVYIILMCIIINCTSAGTSRAVALCTDNNPFGINHIIYILFYTPPIPTFTVATDAIHSAYTAFSRNVHKRPFTRHRHRRNPLTIKTRALMSRKYNNIYYYISKGEQSLLCEFKSSVECTYIYIYIHY